MYYPGDFEQKPLNWWDAAIERATERATENAQDKQKAALEKDRRQLWISVATAVAGAINCKTKDVPGLWADQALADFDKRFK